MKNLLNNLLNWVLKKGSSETKKDHAWGEKDQVKRTKLVQKRTKLSEKDQAEQKGNKLGEKGTSLEMNPCVRGSEVREVRGSEAMSANHALITQLSRNNHPISLRAIRYAAVLLMVLMVGVGNMWGTTFTPAQIAATGGTTINNIKVSTSITAGTAKKCSTQSSVAAISLSSSSDGDYNSNYIEIQATSGTITSLSLQARGNSDNSTGAMVIVFWSGDAQATYSSYSTSFNYLNRNGTDCDDAGYVEISVPSNTKTVRLYKKIYVKDGAISGASGKATVQAPGTYNIFGISALASTSCLAADLTAANITSNGDQVVGTGITFSKVGSPASGDTWYWQTSSTGTDKTYNASSNYTTATTAGSYTVYLRAYNSGSDCWGTAISKTNTIFCSNVYNGENVAKGSTTASDWTIYSSSSMALTSGSSNGYSYWYQAASGSSDYVQFDGSASLVSGDKIIIRWTHTNGSDKTLSLTINGSGVSLTSGSAAKNSVLTEAVYDVTSTTSVTSIKLNSSSSKGCIIYQVSIVKAVCGSSCTAPTAVYVTQTAGSSDMVAGESFTLSAATSTGVEDGATYQWYRNSTEVGTNSPTFTVPSCTNVDAGTYWCKITNPCSADAHTTNVTGYGIKVWQVLLYESSTWNSYDLTSTGTKTGRMSRQLAPGTYYIKLTHNNGVDFGVNTGETISEISATTPSPWTLYGSQNNIKLTVTTAGEYTFDVNYTSADYPTLSVTYPPSTISSCDKIYFCPTVNSIATGSAKFSIYFYNATTNAWANCYLVSGTEYADDAKYVAFAPSTATGWTGMIVVRYSSYISNWDNKWNQSEDITYNGYNYIVGRNEWTSDKPEKFKTHLNSFYSSTTPAMSAASYATTVDGTTNASTNLTGATISYASDDPSVATVNSSGVITGVAAGETTITASVGSCTVGSATVTISKNTPTQFTVSGTTSICSGDNTNITLSGSQTGASYQLKKGGVNEGEPKAGTGSSLTWSVSAAGTYTVSAVETAKYAALDMTGNAVITVKTPVTISWNTAPADGTAGGSMTASVTTNYSDGVAYAVTSASPAGCVTINSTNGAISYVAAGTATITATVTGAGDYCGSANVSKSITVTAPASALITYNLNVGTSAGTTLKSSTSTTDGTNITNIDIDQTNDGANGDGASDRTTKLAIKTGANGADWAGDPTNYEIFKFKVACGKKMTPSKIRMKVANVGGASADNIKYKAVMSDNFGHSLTGTYVVATQNGTVETFDIDNADASKYFQGEVTLKLWAWTIASKDNGGSAFRMGTPLEIFGEVGAQATPSATITWTTQPANGTVGDADFAYAVSCSDGSSVTVTSANTTYATIVGGKLHYAAAGTTHLVASATDACGNVLTPVNSNDFTVSEALVLTELEENTLYKVADMVPNGYTLTTDEQYGAGISANTKFEVLGDPSKAGNEGGAPEMKNISNVTIDGTTFGAAMYLKRAAVLSSSLPTSHAVKFIVPGTGTLAMYVKRSDRLYLIKEGGSAISLGSSDSNEKVEKEVTAGTYYIYANNTNTVVYGVKFYVPAPEVTAFSPASGSTVKTGATVTITGTTGSTIYYMWGTSTPPANAAAVVSGGTAGTSGAATVTTTGISSSNTYLYAVAVKNAVNSALATASYTIDDTAPTFVSSVPANGATDQTVSGTIVLTFSEALGSVDATKFTLTGATKGAVAIDGSDATKVNIAYSGASNESTVTLSTAAAAVSDLAGNALAAALSDIAFTTIASSGCETIVDVEANSATTVSASVGSGTVYNPSSQANPAVIKLNSSGYVELTPKAGSSFAAGNTITVVIYNQATSAKTTGFRLADKDTGNAHTTSIAQQSNATIEATLAAEDITDGKVKIYRYNSDGWFVSAMVEACGLLPSCTTPILPTLSNQTVCPGSDIAAWDATQTAVLADGETASYSWKKKGNDTEIEDEATLDLGAATESMAGTYVVTVTVSKAGNASSSASKEVTLTVTPATEEPSVTQSPAKVYPNDDVTLTATCGSAGTITWAWFTCNSDGTGEAVITGKTTATCAITAPASAGTYYYKVKATGDDTNACGTASHIHTLTVTAASECENYFWFTYADDATSNGVINNRSSFFSGAPTGSSNSGTYKFTLDGTEYTATKNTGSKSISISFTVPEGSTADFVMNGKSSSSNTVTLSHSGGLLSYDICASGNYDAYSQTGLTAGTWTLTAGSNWTLAALAVHVCHASSCTDAVPEIAAVNNTVCSGTELSITATGYETSPTSIQWQKLNSSTSAWDNISGATEATYSVASAAAEHAGSYRCVVTKGCARTSNTVTITIQSAPVFGDVPSSVTVMQTIALSISTVEASDAASYKWYKSANNTWDESDPEIGTSKNLIKAYADEATGSPSYYVICRATNSCGTTTSSAIAVNVTAYVAEDCADKGNEGEAQFSFENTSCGSGNFPNTSTPCWNSNSRSKYLTYTAPDGKYLKTAKVTVAVSSGSKCGYAYSTNSGSTWTYAELSSLNATLTEKTIDLSGSNVTDFRISRNLQDGGGTDHGVTSGSFYLSKACFEYTDACTATTVTPSGTGSETHTIGSSFTEPTFTVKHGGTAFDPQPEITYTSSNEDIATVDDDGTVNFQGMAGSVTITAAYAGDATYCASEGHYTITVSCSDDEPKIVPGGTVNMSGCNSSVVLNAKKQDGTAFAGGTYQWYRDGEAISGATSASYTAVQAGVYTVERTGTGGCTNLSSNSATVTSETVEPEIEHLAPFQYYHVDKTYSDQMKMRHLFTVKGSAAYGSTGKNFKMELSKNGAAATDVTTSNAFSVVKSADNTVDTVMIDLNKLNGKYAKDDELVLTCKAVDCEGNVSSTYKDEITIHVIDATPTMALILNGKGSVVGGDFLEDYEPKNLQEQTGSKTWSGEWPMYTDLKTEYNVTPVNGYAPFNKLNYEPFDIIFLTDFPKASKSDAAATILDDMAALCDYRPLFSFKTHMVHKSPSKWAAKGFTTSPTENKGDGRTYLNIVCYAHPMFEEIKTGDEVYTDASDGSQLVYKMLSGTGYEKSKGMQGFEIDAAENFVTIGLTHYNASVATAAGVATWTPDDGDRMLVSSAERQANPEARMILLSLNAGAHSKLTEKGRAVVMKSLEYLIQTSGGLIEPADCSYTFDNAAGDNNWNTAGNWGPRHNAVPGAFTSARIAAPAVVDIAHAVAMEVRIVEGGSITIPAGKGLEVKSTIRHMDGSEISPTEISELTLEASSSSNGTLIFNNNTGDTKATVWAFSKGFISEGVKNYQYIGTPFNELNALYNYYGSWIYSWGIKKNGNWGWVAVKNGGPMHAWTGYCISQESPTYYETSGTMTATGTVDIAVPAGNNMVVGNSWTAPIDINALTPDDLEGLVANIYFFNTGVDKNGTGGAAGERYAGGTYVTVPVEVAKYDGEDDHINSMQGFFVKNTSGSDGTLHLDYERHVRGTTRGSIIGDALHAPARRAALDSNEPVVLKMKVSGENYDDKLLLLEREDFTEGFDNGWDGDKWDGNESSLYIYTTDEEGTENSVSAIPELEGTIIGFRAGGEDDAYTLNFEYLNSDEPLYLFDTENNTYTQIMTGATYRFFTSDKEKHTRFIITRNSPQVATDIGNGEASGNVRAKKFILNDKMYIMINGLLYDATGKVVK